MRPIRCIRTKYYGHTNTKPAYVKATTDTGTSIKESLTPHKDTEEAHKVAARKLAKKLNWGKIEGVGVYAGDCYWTFTPDYGT